MSENNKTPRGKTTSLRNLIDHTANELDGANLFFGHGTDNAYDEAVFLVLRSLNLPFDISDDLLDKPVSKENSEIINENVRQRILLKKPVAYIVGEAWFAGLCFYINESTLIPRSPLAELIQDNFSPWCEAGKVKRILDIGTGCGCIAIASAFAFPEARIDAIDISDDALSVANKNVEHFGLAARVSVIHSDVYQNLGGNQYDLIIANPPYVSDEEYKTLPEEYRHEPQIGLDGGEDGLKIVHCILDGAKEHLTVHGVLVVEVGNSQPALINHFPDKPFLWLEFEQGGEGVFLLSRDQL